MWKKIALLLGGLLLLLVTLLSLRAMTVSSRQLTTTPVTIALDEKAAAARLSEAIRLKTISYFKASDVPVGEFLKFHRFLEQKYPLVHKHLKREIVNKYSLLYTWKGSEPKQKPALWLAHMDVVPVEKGTLKRWKQPPYSGKNDGTYIWGRGTLDDKNCVLAILEAIEMALKKGFRPKRTLLLAFGHDEEKGGSQGAAKIAALLKKRGVRLNMVLDEGLAVTKKLVPGVSQDVALIGIAEKGDVTIRLQVKGTGGHSSMPPPHTALGILASAIHRMEANPMPTNLHGPVRQMFGFLRSEMGFGQRLVFSNLWLFEPVVLGILKKKHSTAAQIRTTQAITVARAGSKENVLPASATALVNYRILPGDSIEKILAHVRKAVKDPRVKLKVMFPHRAKKPTPISSTKSKAFLALQTSISEVFRKTVVAPSLVMATTDSAHFVSLSDNVYRFAPFPLTKSDLARIHGANERIAIKDYAQMIRFYRRLLTRHHR